MPILPGDIEDTLGIARHCDPAELIHNGYRTLRRLRARAQAAAPHSVLLELSQGARLISAAATLAGGSASELWLLAARYAEFTGWMAQEAGSDEIAELWTSAAESWAARGGDHDMRSYHWERTALAALYRGDAKATISLARRGGAQPGASARVIGLAKRREAQGHALAGDRSSCMRALDEAAELLAQGPTPYPRGASWGPNTIADSSTYVLGSCLFDLGVYEDALTAFRSNTSTTDSLRATRTHARFAVREALALTGAGETDEACTLIRGVLPSVLRVDSATIRADLRRLVVQARRHRHRSAVRDLIPDLHAAIRTR